MWPSMVTHTRNLCSAFNPSKCTHTAVNTHSGCSVPCSRVSPQSWYWRWKRVLNIHSPPIYNPCQTWDSNPWPSGYKPDSLSIRPRLPQRQNEFTEWVLPVCQETRGRSVPASCRSRNDWQWTHLNCLIYQTCKCLGNTHNGDLFISLTEDTARTGSAHIIRDCPGKRKRHTPPDIEACGSSLMSETCKAMLAFPSQNPQSHMPNMFAIIEPCISQTRTDTMSTINGFPAEVCSRVGSPLDV